MKISDLKAELDRAVMVLGKEIGECQNAIDIAAWVKDKYVTKDEAETLYAYNKLISRRM